MSDGSRSGPNKPLGARDLLMVVGQFAAAGIAVFLSAGRIDWLYGWIYVCAFAALTGLAYLVILPRDPELAAERRNAKRLATRADRAMAAPMSVYLPVVILVVAGLGERLGWRPSLPAAVRLAGLLTAVLGYLFTLWALSSNTFFSSVVRIQSERGHHLITGGPYRIVRHPGYAGFIAFWAGSALLLGSVWALIPTALLAGLTALRVILEERTLKAGLDGYVDYVRSVRYRLLPGIW
jgi:protein-S-isoprenylcysteine O-methyltransferase Ste14